MADKTFTYSDVSEHNTKKDLYIVVHDKVYNASSFVDEHPYVLPVFYALPPSLTLSHSRNCGVRPVSRNPTARPSAPAQAAPHRWVLGAYREMGTHTWREDEI